APISLSHWPWEITMIELLIAKLWPYMLGVLALVVAYFGVKAKGVADQRMKQAAQINEQADKARKESRDVQNTVSKMGDDPISDKLKSDWLRSDKGRD